MSERTNEDRAETGRQVVNAYVALVYGREASIDEEGDDSTIIDTLTDILHYAVAGGHDYQTLLDWAMRHVEAELEDAEGLKP